MNEYRFKELFVGQKESFAVTVNDKMMADFLTITKDTNPLHNDLKFAKSVGHPGKVVYGMLSASLLSTLAGVYLPGKYSLIEEIDLKFIKPVYIGDTLTIIGEVIELNDSVEQMVSRVSIRNQDMVKVLRGKMKIGFLHER